MRLPPGSPQPSDRPASPTPSAAACLAALVRDVVAFAPLRVARVAALTIVAVCAEGAGLLLLVPILGLVGVDGPVRTAGSLLDGLGIGAFGLEPALALYVVLVGIAATVVQARWLAVLRLRLDYVDDLRQRLHTTLMGMEWRAFARLRGAEVAHILATETDRSAIGVEFLLRMAGWAVEVPVLLLVTANLSPAMTAAGLLLAGLSAVLMRPLNHRTFALGRAVGEASRAWQADLADDLAGMRVVRSFALETARRERFSGGVGTQRERQLAYQRAAGIARTSTQIGAAAIAAVAVLVAMRGFGVALADTLVLIAAFARMAAAAVRIQDGWRMVLHALPAHAATQERMAEWRAAAEAAQTEAEAPSMPLLQEIRLEGVSYRHAEGGRPALDGVDVVIPARAVTAVVGPSGAGKSTLGDLLLGLLVPVDGHILVDGRPLDGAARRAWRARVGYVPQDGFLFHDSIRANLALAAPEAGEAAIWTALEQAAAADFVRGLPRGLDTVVGDRGTALSGGERQRLSLARALLRAPDLLILDEATSALDGESERRVLASLDALRGKVTLVVVAHRAFTVRGADRVVVLDGGRVATAGDWQAVAYAAGPLLAQLHLTT